MRTITVEYLITDEVEALLQEVLQLWQNVEVDGRRPFKNDTADRVFQDVMMTGSIPFSIEKLQFFKENLLKAKAENMEVVS